MYSTFTFYQNTYKGFKITDSSRYTYYAQLASSYIDELTRGAAESVESTDTIYTKLQMAECSVADSLYANDELDTVSSESVGNHSKSYRQMSRGERQMETVRMAAFLLRGTGLLYRGMH